MKALAPLILLFVATAGAFLVFPKNTGRGNSTPAPIPFEKPYLGFYGCIIHHDYDGGFRVSGGSVSMVSIQEDFEGHLEYNGRTFTPEELRERLGQ